MSYWDLSDGSQVEAEKEFEAPSGGGNLIFPEGSSLLASLDEIKWNSFQGGEEHISARWNILAPEEFSGRKVFQKLYPEGDAARAKDEDKRKKKADTAKRMLAAIDANCGGKIVKLGKKPSDEDFAMHLTNKPMIIRLGVWDMDGKQGNWVQAVAPASKGYSVDSSKVSNAPTKSQSQSTPGAGRSSRSDMDDEIPF